jgi:selenide,water dikinase
LAEALAGLPQSTNPNLLVGFNKADDAGVYRLSDTQALVQTVDFFPPIVDDPYSFGQIAAANALSDVYAMGGTPLTALNIVGFPVGVMPTSILTDILRGGNAKVEEAGAVVIGGHSIKDKELKYGLAITGVVDPRKVITNSGARVGDLLFLTKPLGTGIIATGIKRDVVDSRLADRVIAQMATLNRVAAHLMVQFGAHAATDITGFGLLGHAYEMACGSEVSIRLIAGALPLIPEAVRLAGEGVNPGGASDNRSYLQEHVSIVSGIDKNLECLLYDPQTSGGLLIAIAADRAGDFQIALKEHGLPDTIVGQVLVRQKMSLMVECD